MKMFKWQRGRQGGKYWKFPMVYTTIPIPWDMYILKYEEDSYPHPTHDGLDKGSSTLQKSDIEERQLGSVEQLVTLSNLWALPSHHKQPTDTAQYRHRGARQARRHRHINQGLGTNLAIAKSEVNIRCPSPLRFDQVVDIVSTVLAQELYSKWLLYSNSLKLQTCFFLLC